MNGVHDLGGTDGLGPVVVEENEPVWHAEWEKAAFGMFPFPFAAGWFNVDRFRFGIEQMHPAHYLLSPLLRALAAHRRALRHPGGGHRSGGAREAHPALPREPGRAAARHEEPRPAGLRRRRRQARRLPAAGLATHRARFTVGDRVRVRDDSPKGHTRRARYVRGRTGGRHSHHGTFVYPDSVGNGGATIPSTSTRSASTAPTCGGRARPSRTPSVYFDVWEPYLEPAGTPMEAPDDPAEKPVAAGTLPRSRGGDRRPGEGPRVDHDREGAHDHRGRRPLRRDLRERGRPAARRRGRGQGVDRPRVQEARFSRTARKACAELGIGGLQGEDMVVVENTDTVHNVIVCTLCSCYPWPTLGLPPNWYKQPGLPLPHGARAPQAVLARGLRLRRPRLGRDPGVGLQLGDAVLGASPASRRHRRAEREGAGRARDPRLDDRRRAARRPEPGMRPDTTELGDARRRVEQLLTELPGPGGDAEQLSSTSPGSCGPSPWPSPPTTGALRLERVPARPHRRHPAVGGRPRAGAVAATTSAGSRRSRPCSPAPVCLAAPELDGHTAQVLATPRAANHHEAHREPVAVDPART